MPTRLREYHRPADVAEALQLLRRSNICTTPLMLGPRPAGPPAETAEAVLDLRQLNLAYIRRDAGGKICLGVLTTLQDLINSDLLKAQANGLLPQAAEFCATSALRQAATLGGALLQAGGPPEILLALLALDAEASVATGRGTETRPAAGLQIAPDELLLETNFPRADKAGGALERVARTPRDTAIVAAASVVEASDGICRRARLALAGAGPQPARMIEIEKDLEGQPFTPELLQAAAQKVRAEVQPASDYRGSAEYRRAMAGVLAHRALLAAWQRATT